MGDTEHLLNDSDTSLLGTETALFARWHPDSTCSFPLSQHIKQIGGVKSPEAWTGNLIGKMHNKGITYDDLAEEMGVTKSYISMILNGKRKPPGIRGRMDTAVNSIVQRRNGIAADDLLLENDTTEQVQ